MPKVKGCFPYKKRENTLRMGGFISEETTGYNSRLPFRFP